MNAKIRPDLSNILLIFFMFITFMSILIILFLSSSIAPGSTLGQTSASIGSVLLISPFLFAFMKRSGFSKSPPFWFNVHIVLSLMGSILIAFHVSSGNWLTPPGVVLVCLIFLLLQGGIMRVILSQKFSLMFANNARQNGFNCIDKSQKETLHNLIQDKISLLIYLDPTAEEALFSPTLKHWFYNPYLSFKYQLLVDQESKILGVKQSAGYILSWSRRLHMLVSLLFISGLLLHVLVMLFFANYAANGGDIDWWYITAWGN